MHTQCATGSATLLSPPICLPIVNDIAMGWDFLGAVLDSDIKEHNIVLMVSLDGVQLYDSKDSDCWMYIWIIGNLSPDTCYH